MADDVLRLCYTGELRWCVTMHYVGALQQCVTLTRYGVYVCVCACQPPHVPHRHVCMETTRKYAHESMPQQQVSKCTKTSSPFSKLGLRLHMPVGKTHDVVFPKVSI